MKQIKLSDKRVLLLVLLVVGILLMLMPEKTAKREQETSGSAFVLEQKIATMIEKTYKINDVSVILTYDTNGEKITSPGSEEDLSFGKSASEPFIVSEKLPYVRGVLISAKNISKDKSEELQRAVATLLGISSSKVNIIYSE